MQTLDCGTYRSTYSWNRFICVVLYIVDDYRCVLSEIFKYDTNTSGFKRLITTMRMERALGHVLLISAFMITGMFKCHGYKKRNI